MKRQIVAFAVIYLIVISSSFAAKICPECGFSNDDADTYCGECGAPLPEETYYGPKVCPECGEEWGPDDNFCGYCGVKLVPKEAPEPAETGLINITVSTDPYGAEIYVDGEKRGKSPLPVRLEPGRSYEITAEMKGYEKGTKVLTADPDWRTVFISLAEEDEKPREVITRSLGLGVNYGVGIPIGSLATYYRPSFLGFGLTGLFRITNTLTMEVSSCVVNFKGEYSGVSLPSTYLIPFSCGLSYSLINGDKMRMSVGSGGTYLLSKNQGSTYYDGGIYTSGMFDYALTRKLSLSVGLKYHVDFRGSKDQWLEIPLGLDYWFR
jgi:hypothetical protein